MRSSYTITDLTRKLDVTTRTLRFDELRCYHQEGRFEPVRPGRPRRCRPADRARLKLILRGHRLGRSRAEIRDIIARCAAPPGEPAQRGHRIARIAEKRAELEAKRRDISQTPSELDPVGPAVGNGSKR